jgi:hypothetical protein
MSDKDFDLTLKEAEQKEKEKLAGVHYIDVNCECIANGAYCSKFVVSTNDTTEFVTLSFTPIGSRSPNTILITKKEFGNFTRRLTSFLNAFMHDASGKPLIKG